MRSRLLLMSPTPRSTKRSCGPRRARQAQQMRVLPCEANGAEVRRDDDGIAFGVRLERFGDDRDGGEGLDRDIERSLHDVAVEIDGDDAFESRVPRTCATIRSPSASPGFFLRSCRAYPK